MCCAWMVESIPRIRRKKTGQIGHPTHRESCVITFMQTQYDERETIVVRIPGELVRQLDDLAARDDRSRSYVVRQILSKSLSTQEKASE